MCSHCGCEAEPVIETLMEEHTGIAAREARITAALAAGDRALAAGLVAELADYFDHHRRLEEAGLFAQLHLAGEATGMVESLCADHRRLVDGLRCAGVAEQPERLEELLGMLRRHAETENTDLFPFALQVLPNAGWGAVEAVHQHLLAA